MPKTLIGIVTSLKMQDTAIVEVVRRTPHPLYRKLIRRTKRYKADTKETPVRISDSVEIVETHPISKDKHFKIKKILTSTKEKK